MNNFNRKIDCLRISITDRCNLRCMYCMPKEGIINRPQAEMLTFEEIIKLVKIFVSLGISKIRLTGGEPLVRRGIIGLIKSLSEIESVEEVCLTTNGILLSFYAEELKKAGLKRINISLDTLKEDRFYKITKSRSFYKVLEGIDKAKTVGFHPLKLNMVVMNGVNEDEIINFVEFILSKNLVLRFIEFMNVTPLWREDYCMPIEIVKKICERRFILKSIEKQGFGPAEYYKAGDGIIGFINTNEENCKDCTRLRLTSTGELKVCLYENKGVVLRDFLREGFGDDIIRDIIKTKMEIKEVVTYNSYVPSNIYMYSLGG